MNSPIGVFDSGFGGIDILRGIVASLPKYDYVYLGDTARAPYGSRSQELILQFSQQAVEFFIRKQCPLVLFACNTASSEALRCIQQSYEQKVLGVIIPAVEEAVSLTANNRIGIIATEGTVQSKAFTREIKKIHPEIEVFEKACPVLVPIVESGEHASPYIDHVLSFYLEPLLQHDIDTLILGCTHYGILEKRIQYIVGKNITVISESSVVANKLKVYLNHHPEIEIRISRSHKRMFYTTDLTDKFTILGSLFFGKPIQAKKIFLD